MTAQIEKAAMQIDGSVWQHAFPNFQKLLLGCVAWDLLAADFRLVAIVCNQLECLAINLPVWQRGKMVRINDLCGYHVFGKPSTKKGKQILSRIGGSGLTDDVRHQAF